MKAVHSTEPTSRRVRRVLAALLLLSPVTLAPACDQPSRICDLICECEHCNDIVEELRCEAASASQEVAEIYGCLDEWTAYADCFENEGTCIEDEANYTTREDGSCSEVYDSGLNCTDNSDCLQLGGIIGARCEGMTCVYDSCADSNGQPCISNSECPGGEDKCGEELEKLAECENEASAHDSVGGIGFGT